MMLPMDKAHDSPPSVLNASDHSRDSAGLQYIYPVVSRRARGVSIGINLNTNNACNWACSYCQVPGLSRGGPPDIDLAVLRAELDDFLRTVLTGEFMVKRVPEGLRRLNDIAFSGNGEPTASPSFPAAVDAVLDAVARQNIAGQLKLVVISNGSHAAEPAVIAALARLAAHRGELWFKLDRGLAAGRRVCNGVDLPDHLIVERLRAASAVIPTWVQTCLFSLDGVAPGDDEQTAYLELLVRARRSGAKLAGVLLYSLARPSLQPDAERLAALDQACLEQWARPLRDAGLEVRISA